MRSLALFEVIWITIKQVIGGTATLTLLAIILLFFTSLIFSLIIPAKVEKFLRFIFFPGSLAHQLIQSLAIKSCGYELQINFHMSFDKEFLSQTIKGELKSVKHAFVIGFSTFINLLAIMLLILFGPNINNFFSQLNFPIGYILRIYLLLSFVLFSLPTINDLMLPLYSLTVNYLEVVTLITIGIVFWIIGLAVWGWLIPTLNFIVYCIVLYILVKNGILSSENSNSQNYTANKKAKSDIANKMNVNSLSSKDILILDVNMD